MSLDPRTPVLVGAAAVTQRLDTGGEDAVGLMIQACQAAGADAGAPDLIRDAELVLVPKGSWTYPDPGRAVASALGNQTARSVLAELGVLQTTLIERAASTIAGGRADVAVVVGGEARWRDLVAGTGGGPAFERWAPSDGGTAPDEVLRPEGMIISAEEIGARLVTAVSHYALIENARRRTDQQSLEDHAKDLAELWAGFSAVAGDNPLAWNREPMTSAAIRASGPKNRPLAWPYNKWHNSQWNVDQAACLILCSVEAARSHGVPPDRWVFPHAIAESNDMVPVSRRVQIHRCPGFALAGASALGSAGLGVDDVAHIDLYSCFPIAVRVQAAELGLGSRRPLTVTGGMTFAGGPLNNYVLQSTAQMAQILRSDPGSAGLVTAVSGMLTKQGVSVWSAKPPTAGYRSADVSREVREATATVEVVTGKAGPATVATYTVLADGLEPASAVIVADLPDGRRSIAVTADADLAAAMTRQEWCGQAILLDESGGFSPLS